MKKLLVTSLLTLTLSLNCFGFLDNANTKQLDKQSISISNQTAKATLFRSSGPDRPDPWG